MAPVKSEEWDGYGRRVEAHLARIEAEIGVLRDTLRDAGIEVRRQRTRIRPENENAVRAKELLDDVNPRTLTPSQVAAELDITSEYAYDLLMALVATSQAQKVGRGKYQSVAPLEE
jgi:hypothetical protein